MEQSDFYTKAADFIKGFEGFAAKAMWDVNAYRLGYGSDTITLDTSGTFRKVVKNDVTTKELATIDLSRRIKTEFEPRLKNQLGIDTYSKLPDTAKIALLSLCYNYGSITKKAIKDAAKSLDMAKLKEAIVQSTYNDNARLGPRVQNALRARRQKEADYIIL